MAGMEMRKGKCRDARFAVAGKVLDDAQTGGIGECREYGCDLPLFVNHGAKYRERRVEKSRRYYLTCVLSIRGTPQQHKSRRLDDHRRSLWISATRSYQLAGRVSTDKTR
jgi:hypothetical protein